MRSPARLNWDVSDLKAKSNSWAGDTVFLNERRSLIESKMRRDGGTGRRSGLKIRRSQGRGGSTPPPGTIDNQGFVTLHPSRVGGGRPVTRRNRHGQISIPSKTQLT